ncbi:MAG: hypothetical protein ABI321_24540 [Polyangia bacterium]
MTTTLRALALSLLTVCAAACHHKKGPGDGQDGSVITGDGGMMDTVDAGDADLAGADFSFPTVDQGPCSTAVTCDSVGANCGPVSDGCGGILQCGACSSNESCGGGGTPSVCGTACIPTTCAQLGFTCGPAGDGCGNQLDCGTCTGNDTCGGGGEPSKCGYIASCMPTTCAQLGYTCGPAGDGCGNQLECGTCSSPQVCGGGGPSKCGAAACTPLTCASIGTATCGPIGDGCGGILQCGDCSQPKTCGGQSPGQCGIPTSCTNLCQQQVTCSDTSVTTTVTGTVLAPNGVDPLPNVLVYIPNGAVAAFAPGVQCDQCASGVSGAPLVSAASDYAGHFTLKNVPVGSNIPLVVQTGRWRRQTVIPTVASCTNTALPATLTRLPRNQSEGDIPLMAFATGSVDALECVMRKIGVDDSEFTKPSGTGRIQLYVGDGTIKYQGVTYHLGGANAGSSTPAESTLVGSATKLARYDMVLFPCGGAEHDRTSTEQSNVIDYANAGGRVFATHFSYGWLYNDAPFSSTAAWDINQGTLPDQTGYIDTDFPKGQLLSDWLQVVGASTTPSQIPLNTLRWDADSIVAPAQRWMSINDANYGVVPMHYTFNTPVGVASDKQCGRVLFDDFHVENHGGVNYGSAYGLTFPNECDNNPMTPQEKLLEFMIFDLGSCVTPDVPTCTPVTCASQAISCGPAGDGCGGSLDCGSCPSGQSCGGGGTPSVCGAPSCTATTCTAQGLNCGPAGDGCGGPLSCGTCVAPQTCGGGGKSGVCGNGSCTPTTCTAQGLNCGPAGDGCGGSLSCGTCPSGQTCGGGGKAGICGSQCTPKTCVQLGYSCGPAGDGCGNQLNCGDCTSPQTCGGGGKPNVCGGGVIN